MPAAPCASTGRPTSRSPRPGTGTRCSPATGRSIQNGDVTTDSTADIDVGVYDLDGDSGNTIWTINDRVTINAQNIDVGNNRFDGTLDIESWDLEVNTAAGVWQMDGDDEPNGGRSPRRSLGSAGTT